MEDLSNHFREIWHVDYVPFSYTVLLVSIVIVFVHTIKNSIFQVVLVLLFCCNNKNTYLQQIQKNKNALLFKKIIFSNVTANDTGP